jgi:hypothetical protein
MQVQGATPPVISSVAVSGTNRTSYPLSLKALLIQFIAVVFPAQGPPVITILLISIVFSSDSDAQLLTDISIAEMRLIFAKKKDRQHDYCRSLL